MFYTYTTSQPFQSISQMNLLNNNKSLLQVTKKLCINPKRGWFMLFFLCYNPLFPHHILLSTFWCVSSHKQFAVLFFNLFLFSTKYKKNLLWWQWGFWLGGNGENWNDFPLLFTQFFFMRIICRIILWTSFRWNQGFQMIFSMVIFLIIPSYCHLISSLFNCCCTVFNYTIIKKSLFMEKEIW